MAYGFHEDFTKANVGEVYQFAINEDFANQTTKNITYTLPDGWEVANTIITSFGIIWDDSQFYYGTLYGDLTGSAYDGWTLRASVLKDGSDNKLVLTLKYKERFTGNFRGVINIMRTS